MTSAVQPGGGIYFRRLTQRRKLFPPFDDVSVGGLPPGPGLPLGLPPGAAGVATAGTLSLAAPQGMVVGIHGDPPDGGPDAQPAGGARLADGAILVVQIPHLAPGG